MKSKEEDKTKEHDNFDAAGLELKIIEAGLNSMLISSSYPQVTINNKKKIKKEKSKNHKTKD